ncbi:leucine-rich repeat domain-containing protein [Seongchinamella sediminis]|uniref:Leucine-rich repeat domain-containing protein n=1 Tax=Seongchinamella sediminis TaxID=2283635 RepID=A0A3L7DWH7_9GAMM|nr:leucine-rich repeat domain-containing protein [Seongchinamella sediminis]RLQ21938.1 leucine-rich repeat domain-containing protein [Seongchinamella sediminis]
MTRWFLITLLLLSGGCSDLDFKVNDRVVYSPRPLFSDFELADPALQACVEQAVADQKVTLARELTSLNCSHAGISSLEGLELFTGLQQLKLSANEIRNLAPLGKLSLLETLYLDNNQVVDPVPLYELLSLKTLDLAGNGSLQCPAGNALFRLDDLSLPRHCAR